MKTLHQLLEEGRASGMSAARVGHKLNHSIIRSEAEQAAGHEHMRATTGIENYEKNGDIESYEKGYYQGYGKVRNEGGFGKGYRY